MVKEFTISVFSENHIGLLNRVTVPFIRRHVNIESLTTSESSIDGIFRFTIVVNVTEEVVKKLVGQLEKQIDVLKAFYYSNELIIARELALFKVPIVHWKDSKSKIEGIIAKYDARFIAEDAEFFVLENAGSFQENKDMLSELRSFGVLQFVRSGRVAVSKPMNKLDKHLQELEENQNTVSA